MAAAISCIRSLPAGIARMLARALHAPGDARGAAGEHQHVEKPLQSRHGHLPLLVARQAQPLAHPRARHATSVIVAVGSETRAPLAVAARAVHGAAAPVPVAGKRFTAVFISVAVAWQPSHAARPFRASVPDRCPDAVRGGAAALGRPPGHRASAAGRGHAGRLEQHRRRMATAAASTWSQAMVNGTPVDFLVDTGASDVVLAPADAARAGLPAGAAALSPAAPRPPTARSAWRR